MTFRSFDHVKPFQLMLRTYMCKFSSNLLLSILSSLCGVSLVVHAAHATVGPAVRQVYRYTAELRNS